MYKILIVENDLETRQELAQILKTANYYVITANDGNEGLDTANKHLPDLIITDISLPKIDGLSMVFLLRQDALTEAIPIIVLSDRIKSSDLRNAMDAGADDFIAKPFNANEMLVAVENRFKRYQGMMRNLMLLRNGGNTPTIPGPQISDTPVPVLGTSAYCKENPGHKDGTDTECLYFICNDHVQTNKVYEDGKQLMVSVYNEGHFLGYVALLSKSTYKKMVRVMQDSKIDVYL